MPCTIIGRYVDFVNLVDYMPGPRLATGAAGGLCPMIRTRDAHVSATRAGAQENAWTAPPT